MLIRERKACWVDFYHQVKTPPDHSDQCIGAYFADEPDTDYIGCQVMDGIEFLDDEVSIVESLPEYLLGRV